ncbi:MAG: cytochrome c biogenesis protein ResB [Deltaproteobacteria bacterium]|nr:cytochrome c biogenesis protein ResB [Deltaproteobacteria bacterium]
MFRKIYEYIGSRRFSVLLLKILAVYFAYMVVTRFLQMQPPAFYMLWGPIAAWGVFFFLNVAISFFAQRYIHDGNLIFHAAFILAAIGIMLSAAYRFEGSAMVLDGDVFFGDESGYVNHNAGEKFAELAPGLSFSLSEVKPAFWNEKLYFTSLTAKIKYPVETMDNSGELRLNGGIAINGARLRLAGYGYVPTVLLEKNGVFMFRAPVEMSVFPPGSEGVFEIEGYTVRVKVLPDPEMTQFGLFNKSVNITDPVFVVRVEWLGNLMFDGIVATGSRFGFGPYAMTFVELKRYVTVGVVKDMGEPFIFAAFLAALGGLALRIGGVFLHGRKPEEGKS